MYEICAKNSFRGNIYVCSTFSRVRSFHDLCCAHAHAHSLERTLVKMCHNIVSEYWSRHQSVPASNTIAIKNQARWKIQQNNILESFIHSAVVSVLIS